MPVVAVDIGNDEPLGAAENWFLNEKEPREQEDEVSADDPDDLQLTPPPPQPRPRTPGSQISNLPPAPAASAKTQLIAAVNIALDRLNDMTSTLKKSRKPLWNLIEEDYPSDLREVAKLYTMPVTQVSVERLFSALKIFKSDHRNRLKEDILDALLLLKSSR